MLTHRSVQKINWTHSIVKSSIVLLFVSHFVYYSAQINHILFRCFVNKKHHTIKLQDKLPPELESAKSPPGVVPVCVGSFAHLKKISLDILNCTSRQTML